MVKKIHFILPAGGIRGSFQAGFLYDLFTNYKEYFDIYKIDGISVGSINGIATISEEYEVLKNTWLEITKITDFFSNWSNIPLLGNLQNLYHGFWKNGVYNNELLNSKIFNNLNDKIENIDKEKLQKFSCVVTDVNNGLNKIILGDNPKIIDFVTASASPWILANPKEIDGITYTDGALLGSYPLHNVDNSEADLIVIVGFDQEVVKYKKPDCSNMLYFLASLIEITRFHSYNSLKIKELVKSGKVIPITNTMNALMTEFSQKSILEGFKHGQEMAHLFFKTYIKK